MKSFLVYLLKKKRIAQLLLNPLLKLDNLLYKVISQLSVVIENGKHPKHNILKYYTWFQAQVNKDSVVLDIGCNTGSLLNNIASGIKKGVGIEILPNYVMIAKAQCKHTNLEFIHADATEYDFNKLANFNVITLSNVLEHIDKRVAFLKKIISALNGKSCKVLIRVPLITRDWLPSYKKQRGVDYRLDDTHFIEYTEEEIKEELSTAGLEVKAARVKFGEIYLVCSAN